MAGPQLSELGLHKIKGLAALGLTLTVCVRQPQQAYEAAFVCTCYVECC